MRSLCFFPILLAGVATQSASLSAQCTNAWLPGSGVAGVDGQITAMTMWDRDGAGPQPPLLVLGGKFTVAGRAVAAAIATYEPVTATWATLGGGLSGTFNSELHVRALAVAPNGDLIVGGNFLFADGQPVANIARWNGVSWSGFGNGIGGVVTALTCRPNGDIVAAGDFQVADGVATNRIARWSGTTWSAMGTGPNASIYTAINAVTSLPNGDVIVGGSFISIDGVPANRIARWDGAAWTPLGSGLSGVAYTLLSAPNGDVLVGGMFIDAGGVAATGIARWSGTTWSSIGGGLSNQATAMAWAPNGDLAVGGAFTQAGGNSALRAARWNGTAWSGFGTGLGTFFAPDAVRAVVVLPNGEVVFGGSFAVAGGATVLNLASWSGSAWNPLVPASVGTVEAILGLPNGDVLVGGTFSQLDGVAANRIARWNGSTWAPLGSGVSGTVRKIVRLANGDIVVAGSFQTAGGAPANRIARWDGTTWSPLGSGLAGDVYALVAKPNGELFAGGGFPERVARWNGLQWQPLLPPFASAPAYPVAALELLSDGVLVAAGSLVNFGGSYGVGRWDGVAWTTDPGSQSVSWVVADAEGQLFGISYNSLMRWNGSSWQYLVQLPSSYSGAITALPDGSLVVGQGLLPIQQPAPLHRWTGGVWQSMGSLDGGVVAIGFGSNGDLLVGGSFRRVDNTMSALIARRTTSCPASVRVYASGCTGSGGLAGLAAASLPWLGGSFRSKATGLPAQGLGVSVLGLAPTSVPLSTILSAGLPGCSLATTADLLSLLVPVGGEADFALALPANAALVGGVLHQQVVGLDLDAGGAIVGATASNALAITIGLY